MSSDPVYEEISEIGNSDISFGKYQVDVNRYTSDSGKKVTGSNLRRDYNCHVPTETKHSTAEKNDETAYYTELNSFTVEQSGDLYLSPQPLTWKRERERERINVQ